MANQNPTKRSPETDIDTTTRRDSERDFSADQKKSDMGTGKDLKETPRTSPTDRKDQSSSKWQYHKTEGFKKEAGAIRPFFQ